MFDTDTVKAGSPWGAASFAGATGARQPSDVELAYAKHQVCLPVVPPCAHKQKLGWTTRVYILYTCCCLSCNACRGLTLLRSPSAWLTPGEG